MFLFTRFHFSFLTFSILIITFTPVSAAEVLGSISGKVTDVDTGEPLSGVTLNVYDLDYQWIDSGSTDLNGEYEISSLAIGEYMVQIRDAGDYVLELYDDVVCAGRCYAAQKTPVSVVANQATADVDFALKKGGAIGGTVTSADSGEVLSNVLVFIYSMNGGWASSDWTDSNGEYRATGLSAGEYYATVNSAPDYIARVFGGEECVGGCDPKQGVTITVTEGQTTTNIDFSLREGGAISGVVKDDDTGALLSNVSVHVYDEKGLWVGADSTDFTGSYYVSGLPSGNYFLKTSTDENYVDRIYGGIFCLSLCDSTLGTAMTVVEGQETADIDFALTKGGIISGVVTATDGGEFLSNILVEAYDISGYSVGSEFTDPKGQYQIGGLLTGEYYLRFSTESSVYTNSSTANNVYISELYGGVPCPSYCDFAFADVVEVVIGNSTTGVDVSMSTGGALSGNVVVSDTDTPLADVVVEVYAGDGSIAGKTITEANGGYTVTGLAAGYYYVLVSISSLHSSQAESVYLNQIYGGVNCSSDWFDCVISLGHTVDVNQDQVTSEIDFSLIKGGSISGVIVAAESEQPLKYASVEVFNGKGEHVQNASADENGRYQVRGLKSGSYYLKASKHNEFDEQVYGADVCLGCDVTQGEAIDVLEGEINDGVDFILQAHAAVGASISGTVAAFETQSAIDNVRVFAEDVEGMVSGMATTDSHGNYIVTGLPAGNYYVRVFNTGEYVSEIYGGGACLPWCEVVKGDSITVETGGVVSGIDFDLVKGGVITGVVDAVDGKHLGKIYVRAVDAKAQYAGGGEIDDEGNYRIAGLPEGSYFLHVYSVSVSGDVHISTGIYVGQAYDGLECAAWCEATQGSEVRVSLGQVVTGVDFSLNRGGAITGKVTTSDSGDALAFAYVEVYDEEGLVVDGHTANSEGEYKISGLPSGRYFLKASPVLRSTFSNFFWYSVLPNAGDYMAMVYGDLPCADRCDVTRGAAVNVTSGQIVEDIDIALASGDAISGTVLAADTGVALQYSKLSIYDSDGNWLGFEVWTDVDGQYRVGGLSPGSYFLLAIGDGDYENKLYGHGSCGEGCVITSGIPVEIRKGKATEGINFELEQAGELQQNNSSQQGDQEPSMSSGSGGGQFSWELLLLIWWRYVSQVRRRAHF